MDDLIWHELGEPEGKGFADTERKYDRLPLRAKSMVPEVVWNLSRDSSSLFSRFRTNASNISARWSMRSAELAKPHMPASSVSGLDLYGKDEAGEWRWVGSGRPDSAQFEAVIGADLDGANREYMVYFPLFNQLEHVEIGVPADAEFSLLDPDPAPPVAYYGTSIIHGASASRTGMAVPAQLGRRLGCTVIGLGFSGNGKMEREIATLLGEIDARLFVIDCLPNMDANLVRERTIPFVTELRNHRPHTPVLLVEDRTYTNTWITPVKQQAQADKRHEYRTAYEVLRSDDPNLHYLKGNGLLGVDDDAAVDGSHPTDLGFFRMVNLLESTIRAILGSQGQVMPDTSDL